MKNIRKIAIFALVISVLCSLFSLSVLAATPDAEGVDSGKLDMNLKPESFSERLEYALQGTATGMLMVFGVLALLTLILYISKYFLYDLPNKESPEERAAKAERAKAAKEAEKARKAAEKEAQRAAEKAKAATSVKAAAAPAQDDAQLAAVITAAIAAMIESSDYKNEFVGGFRVVSFKRQDKRAWNRK